MQEKQRRTKEMLHRWNPHPPCSSFFPQKPLTKNIAATAGTSALIPQEPSAGSCGTLYPMKKSFRDRVLGVVATIPRGKTLTYKQVASRAGRPHAFRAVGNILRTNFDPHIPCHRVIRSDGTLGGYNRGARKKITLLRAEGFKS